MLNYELGFTMLYHSLTVHRYQSLGSHQKSQPGQYHSELRTPARIPWPRGLWYTEMVCQQIFHWRNLNNLDLEMFTDGLNSV